MTCIRTVGQHIVTMIAASKIDQSVKVHGDRSKSLKPTSLATAWTASSMTKLKIAVQPYTSAQESGMPRREEVLPVSDYKNRTLRMSAQLQLVKYWSL